MYKLRQNKIQRTAEHGRFYMQSPQDRDTCGLAHIMIPPDIDREVYIRQVYDTGRCVIVSLNDDPITNAVLLKHLIQDIVFPQEENQRGSLVFWNNLPRLNQVVITGIVLEEDQLNPLSETSNGSIESFDFYTLSDVRSLRNNTRSISVADQQGDTGQIQLQARGNEKLSRIQLKSDGVVSVDADNTIEIFTEDGINLSIGSEQGEISTINITRDGVFNYTDKYNNTVRIVDGQVYIDTTQVKLGEDATEKAVLGDTLKAKLDQLHDLIISHTHLTSMGPSGVPVNAANFITLKSELSQILSNLVILE